MHLKEPTKEIDHSILKGKKILLADDLELNQFIAKHLVESWGCNVTVANNGKEVLQHLEQNEYDCILMDVQMPEMDGLSATKLIRKLPDQIKSSIPIIALTSNVLKGDRERYLSAGMNDCIGKPYDGSDLFEAIYKTIIGNLSPQNKKTVQPDQNPDSSNFDSKLYDLKMVTSVSGGDMTFIKKMVQLFIETVPGNLEELKTHIHAANWLEASKIAHKLKSTIDSMGIKSLHQDIRKVESNAKQKVNLEEMPYLVQKIELVITDCIHQLQVEL